jgi:hypothetical protein
MLNRTPYNFSLRNNNRISLIHRCCIILAISRVYLAIEILGVVQDPSPITSIECL